MLRIRTFIKLKNINNITEKKNHCKRLQNDSVVSETLFDKFEFLFVFNGIYHA